jgi:uncharacterized protein YvpB
MHRTPNWSRECLVVFAAAIILYARLSLPDALVSAVPPGDAPTVSEPLAAPSELHDAPNVAPVEPNTPLQHGEAVALQLSAPDFIQPDVVARRDDWSAAADDARESLFQMRQAAKRPRAPRVAKPAPAILPVPVLGQWRGLTCEAASARMVAAYFGKTVSEAWIQDQFGFDPNPHKGFRGNPNGWFGGLTDYGVYAEPVAAALQALGLNARVSYGTTYEDLRAALDRGQPVIVWFSLHWDPNYVDVRGGYRLVAGEHAAVVTGYSGDSLLINDPGKGGYQYYTRSLPYWRLFGNMAVFASPKPLSFRPSRGLDDSGLPLSR